MTDTPDLTQQPTFTLEQIAALTGGSVLGESASVVSGVASVEEAEAGDLVFAESPRFLVAALRSRAAAVLTSPEAQADSAPSEKPLVLVANPRAAFVLVLEAFSPRVAVPPGVHPSAQVGANVRFGDAVSVGAHVTLGDGVTLGDRVTLWPGVTVGDGCVIGDDTTIYPNATLYHQVTVGKRCILHAGCVLGADGFGYIPVGVSLKKVPQLGRVVISDDVEIGANSCVDRAKTGVTFVGPGTKVDNLVHIAHNVHIGASCVLIAQVGIAGSTTLGNGVVMAGQSGVKDHVTLGDGVRVAARGGVIGDVPAGATVSGFPARPHTEKMREFAAIAALPDYIKRIRALEKRLAELEAKLP